MAAPEPIALTLTLFHCPADTPTLKVLQSVLIDRASLIRFSMQEDPLGWFRHLRPFFRKEFQIGTARFHGKWIIRGDSEVALYAEILQQGEITVGDKAITC